MDIIMPNLDGVSATAMIRMVTARVPIIAMTSNIRQEDIQTYFQYGKLSPSEFTPPVSLDVLTYPFSRYE
jgi:osomolarity two-component system response regulator SKN7